MVSYWVYHMKFSTCLKLVVLVTHHVTYARNISSVRFSIIVIVDIMISWLLLLLSLMSWLSCWLLLILFLYTIYSISCIIMIVDIISDTYYVFETIRVSQSARFLQKTTIWCLHWAEHLLEETLAKAMVDHHSRDWKTCYNILYIYNIYTQYIYIYTHSLSLYIYIQYICNI
jgi:hypothetical protein